MGESRPSQNGLTQPHVHYSFLKTASEGLSLSEEDLHSSSHDSLESALESLAQEHEYQLELQQRINNSEELLNQSYYELEEDSLEEDSLKETSWSESDESDVEEAQIPTGSNCGEEDGSDNPSKEEITGRCSERRYDPNWENEGEENEGEGVVIRISYLESAKGSQSPARGLTCSPSQDRLTASDRHLQEERQDIPSVPERESLKSCTPPASVSEGSDPSPKRREEEGEAAAACHYNSSSSIQSGSSSAQTKGFKQQRSKKDFIGKNKVTLGLATQPNSYLQLYSQKQTEGRLGQAHRSKEPETRGEDPGHGSSLKKSPFQCLVGAQVELKGQHSRHHNGLEPENTLTNSSSSREVPDSEQDSRSLLHCRLHPNPPVALLWPSVATGTQDLQFHAAPIYFVHQDGKEPSMNLTFGSNPHLPSSYPNFPVFHVPCTGENNQKVQQSTENSSGYQPRSPRRCAFSEPCSLPRDAKHRNPLRNKKIPSTDNPGLRQPVNKRLSSWDSRNIYSEDICSSYVSGNPGPLQPLARNLIGAPSPTEWLIQVAERHHQEISQLADDQLASMLPPVMQRGESDSWLNLESNRESQPCLNRSNSEGYLLQRERQSERKEKENRKGPRTNGYIKMDMKLGGLGPDYETIKEKAEKIKHQKEYAKQIKEHNMKNLISARKPPPRAENKLVVSRQKALEYAKSIPKPKIVLSKPSEQEPKEEKVLARTLNGESLPPISSLESLQSRHEREKQVVAAFKTLHIV